MSADKQEANMWKKALGFVAHVGGARSEAQLEVRGGLDQAATGGALLLIASCFSALSGTLFVQDVVVSGTHMLPVSAAIGLLWGAFILLLDRRLVMQAVRTDWSPLVWVGLVAKVLLAAGIATSIALPLIITIASPALELELRSEARRRLDVEMTQNQAIHDVAGYEATAALFDQQLAGLRKRLDGEPDSYEFASARQAAELAVRAFETTRAANTPRLASAQRELLQMTAVAGPTPEQQARQRLLRDTIGRLRADEARVTASRDSAEREVAEVKAAWRDGVKNEIEKLTPRAEAARNDASNARAAAGKENGESTDAVKELLRPDFVNKFVVFRKITSDPTRPESAALRELAWKLHFLFFGLEMAAVLSSLGQTRRSIDIAITCLDVVEQERLHLKANGVVLALQEAFKKFEVDVKADPSSAAVSLAQYHAEAERIVSGDCRQPCSKAA